MSASNNCCCSTDSTNETSCTSNSTGTELATAEPKDLETHTSSHSNSGDEPRQTRRGPSFTPRSEVLETGEGYEISLEIPGSGPDLIDIRFENGILAVSAEVPTRYPTRDEQPGAQGIRREYEVGGYERRFRITDDVNAEAIEARYELGVLTLNVPKAERARERRIAVNAG